MNAAGARACGRGIVAALQEGRYGDAHRLLAPVLADRTPFRLLDAIGGEIGVLCDATTHPFLQEIADEGTMGGWIVIGATLQRQLEVDAATALRRARHFVAQAAVWHAVDSIGERVVGAAVRRDLRALEPLRVWRDARSPWVRRALGTGLHNWAKGSRGVDVEGAAKVLRFLEPLFAERDLDAAKGIGWALKSLGRHHPAQLEPWLERMVREQPGHRALMLRKARKYLSSPVP